MIYLEKGNRPIKLLSQNNRSYAIRLINTLSELNCDCD
jgi:hypothetical protein